MGAARARKKLRFDELVEQAKMARMITGDSPNSIELVDPWPLGEDEESHKIRYVVATIRGFAEAHWRYIVMRIPSQRPSTHSPWTIGQADFVEAVMEMPQALRQHLRRDMKKLLDRVYYERPDFNEDTILGLAGIHCFTLAWRHGLVKSHPASTAVEREEAPDLE